MKLTTAASLRLIFALSFLLVGGYYEWGAAVIALCLFLQLLRYERLTLRLNPTSVAFGVLFLGYLVGSLWAVDPGMAVWGAVKHLPLPLFALCLMQEGREARTGLLRDIPVLGAVMTAATFILQFVPALNSSFSVAGRLAGFFQYPNTFAAFLLMGMVILLFEAPAPKQAAIGAVLLFGLVQSGSRAVMLIAVPAVLAVLLVRRSGKTSLWAAVAIACGLGLGILVSKLLDSDSADRFLTVSTGSSTMLGRLLYWKDALPVILSHPFGLGHLGYYFTQGSFQTGVYTVRWVHNGLLQLLLDIGWVSAIPAIFAVCRTLFSKKTGAMERIALLALLAHAMMDFDLQFVSMYLAAMLCMEWESGKTIAFTPKKVPAVAISVLVSLFALYIGVVSALTYGGQDAQAAALYPANTLAQIQLLQQADDADELETLADDILARNESVSLAWSAKALAAWSRGDFGTFMTCKRSAIALAKYSIEEYIDYFQRLAVGVSLYAQAGDTASAQACYQEILNIQTMLEEVGSETDDLAWKLTDQPELTMPEEYYQYIAG